MNKFATTQLALACAEFNLPLLILLFSLMNNHPTILGAIRGIAEKHAPVLLDYLDTIAERSALLHLRAGEHFPPKDGFDYQAAFILSGAFRVYATDNGKENTIRLAAEGDFTMYIEGYKSFNPQIEYCWEAVTDAILLTWSAEDMEYLMRNVPGWYSFGLKVTQRVLLQISIERGEMFNDDATTRYLKFAERYPHIISRVPLRHVANYLGIAPQSLSRIRQQVYKTQNS